MRSRRKTEQPTIKTPEELEKMRVSCRKLAVLHSKLRDFIKPGISTKDIDEYGESIIRELGGVPNFKNYNGYPAAICVSVNDVVVHGIPRKDIILEEGDIVSLVCGKAKPESIKYTEEGTLIRVGLGSADRSRLKEYIV